LTQLNVDESPFVVPERYRVVYRFFLLPIMVAGRYRWCEHVRVVQRDIVCPIYGWHTWSEVGFWDEVMPTPKPEGVDGY
jgi:hypothetical protein